MGWSNGHYRASHRSPSSLSPTPTHPRGGQYRGAHFYSELNFKQQSWGMFTDQQETPAVGCPFAELQI